ncbi:alpha/beta hydrolase fold domain-containing protein [Nonomuraea sp. NPDC047897]|uniref:alpha/beta hydrolase fold domain-containing protein n=1 Tax=Nonomuraea sp. NPDC047897 TaxID=3364346 RepID=UPI0037119DD3
MPRQFPPEFRQRALRLLGESRENHESEYEAIKAVASRPEIRMERKRTLSPFAQAVAGSQAGSAGGASVRFPFQGTAGCILAGESAGGTLLLSALLVLKQAADPLPTGAVAISPQTDLTLSSPSIDANDGQDFVNRAVLDHVRTPYLARAQPDRAPQSPLPRRA